MKTIPDNFFSNDVKKDVDVSDLQTMLIDETKEVEPINVIEESNNIDDINNHDDRISIDSNIENNSNVENSSQVRAFTYKEEADTYIELFDVSQTLYLPKLYRAKISDKAKVDELIDNLPLSQLEKEKIAIPLSKCLEIWGSNVKPETVLIGAIISVEIPRILPLLLAKKDENK